MVDIGDKARKAREGWYEQITKRKAAGQTSEALWNRIREDKKRHRWTSDRH